MIKNLGVYATGRMNGLMCNLSLVPIQSENVLRQHVYVCLLPDDFSESLGPIGINYYPSYFIIVNILLKTVVIKQILGLPTIDLLLS